MKVLTDSPEIDVTRVTTITLPERFDVHEASEFLDRVGSVDASRFDVVSLDGSNVRFIDQAGIEALITSRRSCGTRGVSLRLANQSACTQITLELTGRLEELVPTSRVQEFAA